jgi:ATPase subunit of ABC transporter with duplicated ATPase domains
MPKPRRGKEPGLPQKLEKGLTGIAGSAPALIGTDITVAIPGIREIFDRFAIVINQGDKIGIIGAEGTGKSTLLGVLAQRELPELQVAGVIQGPTVGLLDQFLDPAWEEVAVAEFLLRASPEEELPPERWNDLQAAVAAVLEVGLDPELVAGTTERRMRKLSGGERVRIRIAKLLLSRPPVILLDEPTNDLDLPTLRWLEAFIRRSREPIAFISHDEVLLERAANKIVHLQRLKYQERTQVAVESVGYRAFLELRTHRLEKQAQEWANQTRRWTRAVRIVRDQKEKVRREQEAVKDSSARRLLNKKMRSIKSREGKLERQERIERPEDIEAIRIDFPNAVRTPASRRLLDLEIPELTIGARVLSRGIRLSVRGPEKVVIVGNNGCGKSTLIRQVVAHLRREGAIEFGYYPQDYEEELSDPDRRALDYVLDPDRGVDETFAGTLMARLHIPREEMEAPIRHLSGGQKAKVVLLKLMTGSGFLVLDEPTRNLSPLSNRTLRAAFAGYPGAILAVSHDRRFIAELADRVLELSPAGLKLVRKAEVLR